MNNVARVVGRLAALSCLVLAGAGGAGRHLWASAGEPPAAKKAQSSQPGEPAYPALEALERELARLADSTKLSVVSVIARSRLEDLLGGLGDEVQLDERTGSGDTMARRVGSGVVIDAQGHVATLSSVVAGASEVLVIPSEGKKLRARIKGVDEYSGLAVLSVEDGNELKPVPLGSASDLKIGSFIAAFSNPQGDLPAYSVGVVSGMGVSHGPLRRGPYLKLNAYAAPGAGGGPVLDSKGHMVGVLFGAAGEKGRGTVITWETPPPGRPEAEEEPDAEAPPGKPPRPPAPSEEADAGLAPFAFLRSLHRMGSSGSGVSYAVPVEVVRRVTDQIIRSGSVRRGWLGVTIESSDPGEVRLTRVMDDSPADKAGLAVGDRILSLDGESVESAEVLVERLASSSPGSSVKLGIARGPRRMDVALTLGESPETPRPGASEEMKALMKRRAMEAMPPMPPMPPGRPRLGVVLEDMDDEARQREGAPEGVGLLVTEVQPGTRAAAAGIRPGDVLVEALGFPIRTIPDLRHVLIMQGPARQMEIKLMRDRGSLVVRIPPAPADDTPPPPQAPPTPKPRRAPRP